MKPQTSNDMQVWKSIDKIATLEGANDPSSQKRPSNQQQSSANIVGINIEDGKSYQGKYLDTGLGEDAPAPACKAEEAAQELCGKLQDADAPICLSQVRLEKEASTSIRQESGGAFAGVPDYQQVNPFLCCAVQSLLLFKRSMRNGVSVAGAYSE